MRNPSQGLPSREQILRFIEESTQPAGKREIARAFQLSAHDKILLKALLKDMADEGLIDSAPGRAFHKSGGVPRVTVLRVIDADGDRTTAVPENWQGEGPPPRLRVMERRGPKSSALGPGDRILARTEETERGLVAHPMKKLAKSEEMVLGVLHKEGDRLWLKPVDKRERRELPVSDAGEADVGDLVLAEKVGRPPRISAKVSERLGDPFAPRSFSLVAIHKFGIPDVFGEPVLEEAVKAAKLPLGAIGEGAREDLRDLPIVAIDPADARDHDDAVWAAPDDDPANVGGFKAIVAIADVSFYVRPGGALDREARKRGNSVYFPDRAVPMLPEILSADVCSLRAGEDRGALVCHLTIGKDGALKSWRFARAVIRVAANIAYEDAQAMIDGAASPPASGSGPGGGLALSSAEPGHEPGAHPRPLPQAGGEIELASSPCSMPELEPTEPLPGREGLGWVDSDRALAQHPPHPNPSPEGEGLLDALRPLWACWRALARAREKRAPLELDLPERRVMLDEKGRILSVAPRERLDAHRLIEDYMIAANVAAAKALEARKAPVMYRVHEPPSREKLVALKDYLKTFGIEFALGQVVRPATFNHLIARLGEADYRPQVMEQILRSQTQAYYAPANAGHFGLALGSYAHFTSPIRRYADLLVHRALVGAYGLEAPVAKAALGSLPAETKLPSSEAEQMERIGEGISRAERRAMEAERETIDRYVAAYLSERVGELVDTRITGVQSFGFFATVEGLGGDGLVPVSTLGAERFHYDERAQSLVGEESGTAFVPGQRLKLRLVEASPISASLRFELPDAEPRPRDRPVSRERRPMGRRGRPANIRHKGGSRGGRR
ncbi:MAG: RNB domain-containing ribonuclease [Sphingomonadaceae bacterium]|nr:RNB domain-containing ribonuclease [Sphingomonadaceae bacterium]